MPDLNGKFHRRRGGDLFFFSQGASGAIGCLGFQKRGSRLTESLEQYCTFNCCQLNHASVAWGPDWNKAVAETACTNFSQISFSHLNTGSSLKWD